MLSFGEFLPHKPRFFFLKKQKNKKNKKKKQRQQPKVWMNPQATN
jgi:hypothetical protein